MKNKLSCGTSKLVVLFWGFLKSKVYSTSHECTARKSATNRKDTNLSLSVWFRTW